MGLCILYPTRQPAALAQSAHIRLARTHDGANLSTGPAAALCARLQAVVLGTFSSALGGMSAALWPGLATEGPVALRDLTSPPVFLGTLSTPFGTMGAVVPLVLLLTYVRGVDTSTAGAACFIVASWGRAAHLGDALWAAHCWPRIEELLSMMHRRASQLGTGRPTCRGPRGKASRTRRIVLSFDPEPLDLSLTASTTRR